MLTEVFKLEIVVYPGKEDEKSGYFGEMLENENIDYSKDLSLLGLCYVVNLQENDIKKFSAVISVYILEFYLKEFVLTKVYDEYDMIDVSIGCDVLLRLNDEIAKSDVEKNIEQFLTENQRICIDNYVLFNLKSIMTTIYILTDSLCEKIIYQKCRSDFLSLVRAYSKLNLDFNDNAISEPFGKSYNSNYDNSEY